MAENKYDMIIKIVLLGDSGVGKTNLVLRYTKGSFQTGSRPTIGMDFISKDINLLDCKAKVQFWDTAGQEKYRAISRSYYKLADGIILVYDVSQRESFDHVKIWLDDLKSNNDKEFKAMLIGNKIDLQEDRAVPANEGQAFAEEHDMFFWETSALTNIDNCVGQAFDVLIEESISRAKTSVEAEDQLTFSAIRKNTKIMQRQNESKTQNEKSGCC